MLEKPSLVSKPMADEFKMLLLLTVTQCCLCNWPRMTTPRPRRRAKPNVRFKIFKIVNRLG